MKFIAFIFFVAFSISAVAGGRTNAAVPTAIDLVQASSAGFMVYGDFGNAGSCTVPNQVYVEINHPQYNQIYSTVLAALMAGKRVAFHAHACKPVLWYTTVDVTYNTVESSGAVYISN